MTDDKKESLFPKVDTKHMKLGRKSMYNESYCRMLVDHMANGFTFESFSTLIHVGRSVLYEWRKKHPKFMDAYQVGKGYRSQAWESTLQKIATGELKGSAAAAMFALKNYEKERFRDKQEIEHSGSTSFTLDTGIRRIGDSDYSDLTIDADCIEVGPSIPDNSTDDL